jgi:hypothetical protein
MKKHIIRCLAYGLIITLCSNAQAQLKTLGLGEVKVPSALSSKIASEGRKNELDRVIQSLDGQMMVAIHETRKFELAARSDIKAVVEEQALSGGVISGVDYLVIPSVDDFQDLSETANFTTLGKTVQRRTIRMSLLMKIYDTVEGKLLETASVQTERTIINENFNSATTNSDATDTLLIELAKESSVKAAQRLADVIYPAKVLALTGKTVTLNRGDGTGIAVGQIWQIFAVGEALVDPDTGEILGSEEVYVGAAKITSVLPKFSKGVVSEDLGIVRGSVLRLK